MSAENLIVYTTITLLTIFCTGVQLFYFKPIMFFVKQFSDNTDPMMIAFGIFLNWLSFALIPYGTVLSGKLLLLVIISGACLMVNLTLFGLVFKCAPCP